MPGTLSPTRNSPRGHPTGEATLELAFEDANLLLSEASMACLRGDAGTGERNARIVQNLEYPQLPEGHSLRPHWTSRWSASLILFLDQRIPVRCDQEVNRAWNAEDTRYRPRRTRRRSG